MDRYLELKKELIEDDYWLIKCVGKIEMLDEAIKHLEIQRVEMIDILDETIKHLEIERDVLKEKLTK